MSSELETVMRFASYQLRERLGELVVGATRLRPISILSSIVPILFFGCRRPPNLSGCTRIELHYTRGALNYFVADDRILSEEEKNYVRSFDVWTVSDQNQIGAFALSVNQGRYRGKVRGGILDGVDVTCYRGNDRMASFTVYRGSMRTVTMSYFTYSLGLPDLSTLDPPGIRPFKARSKCALHLSDLHAMGLSWAARTPPPYPDPNRWCDAIVGALRGVYVTEGGQRHRLHSDSRIATMFRCPSLHGSGDVGEAERHAYDSKPTDLAVTSWQSDYAMNPNCRSDSAADTVLLFETNAGWNQHGGPELFRFDNHDPKGGLVLLNDGTVKFIRTEEELKQLRWK